MLLNPAEKYRKLIPLLSHAVSTATQMSANLGSVVQLICVCKILFTIPTVGCSIILNTKEAELDAIAIGNAYATENALIPGKALLHSIAVKSPSAILPATTISINITVTLILFWNEDEVSSSV